MYHFIPVRLHPSDKLIYINACYITKIFYKQKVTHLQVNNFPSVPVKASKASIRKQLKLKPAQRGPEIKITLPSLDENFPDQKKIEPSDLIYIHPLKNGKMKLTFSDKRDLYIAETFETFQKLL